MQKGRLRARLAQSAGDLRAAQALRALCFRGGAPDRDSFDARCQHLLVEDRDTGALRACCRMLPLASGAALPGSYAARYYDLGKLTAYPGGMVEIGRFCVHPAAADPDVLRLAWGALTRFVDRIGAEMLFGCASFAGLDPAPYRDAFALLRARHAAPAQWQPGRRAPQTVALGSAKPDLRRASERLPPLLKTYLAMGGWVSDHAVVDREMQTLHVFCGVEVARIPPARKRLLRALAG